MNQLNESQVEQHVKILAWLKIGLNTILAAGGALVLVLLTGIGIASGEPIAARVLFIVGGVAAVFMFFMAAVGILVGIGLLKRKEWARYLALVVGFFSLINIPLGTALGIYTFFVLLQESATDYFQNPQPNQGQPILAPST